MSLQDRICKIIKDYILDNPIDYVIDISEAASNKCFVGIVKCPCPKGHCNDRLGFSETKSKEYPLPIRNILMGNPKLMMLLLERISSEYCEVILDRYNDDNKDEKEVEDEEPGECIEGKVREMKEGEKD